MNDYELMIHPSSPSNIFWILITPFIAPFIIIPLCLFLFVYGNILELKEKLKKDNYEYPTL